MSDCDVIIVNFNAGPFLADAVVHALASSAVAHVFVIDNASTDDSLDGIASQTDLRLAVIRNTSNRGFAAGCNIGLQRATADYLLLLNPDCRATAGSIERLIEVLETGSRIGMCGPLLLNPDGSEQAGGRRAIPTPRRALSRTLGLVHLQRFLPKSFSDFLLHQTPLPSGPADVEAVSGAAMMVARTALNEVGALDESYFLHCEDLDWCMRFRQRRWRIVFVPDAVMTHEKGVSSRQRRLAAEWHKHWGMIRFYRKFYRERYPSWLMALVVVGVAARLFAVASWVVVTRRRST